MKPLKIYNLLGKRLLVTRESARSLGPALTELVAAGEVVIDFCGIEGLTPSFFDELLTVIERCAHKNDKEQLKVVVLNPPTQLSAKFEAVGRGHNLTIEKSDSGAWVILRKG